MKHFPSDSHAPLFKLDTAAAARRFALLPILLVSLGRNITSDLSPPFVIHFMYLL